MNGVEIALAGYLAFGQLIPHGQQEIVEFASKAGARDAWE
jgi:hypothetical protein